MLHVALCHSVLLEKKKNGETKMSSASPDEEALVKGAQQQGFRFEGMDRERVISVCRTRDGEELRYKLLNTLEFNSTRKRMSVVLRDMQTNELVFLCKGADSIIKERLDLDDRRNAAFMDYTQVNVDQFANEGLRTLLLAGKSLEEDYYEKWDKRF